MITSMTKETGITPNAIGISTAGPVNQKAGSVVGSPNMNCSEIFLRDPLASLFHIPAVMLSDCKAGAVGEYFFGGADTAHTLVYLTISTGLGCGVIANGSLLTGADGNAGEVGHIVVDTRYNILCGCGGTGHWQKSVTDAARQKGISPQDRFCGRQRSVVLSAASSWMYLQRSTVAVCLQ